MRIDATVTYVEGDDTSRTPDELADGFLKAAGGDETKDHCVVNVVLPAGQFGTPPPGPGEPGYGGT